MSKRARAHLPIVLLASILLFGAGCTSPRAHETPEASNAETSEPEQVEEDEKEDALPQEHEYALSSTIEFQGVVVPVDPTWTVFYNMSQDKKREVGLGVLPNKEQRWNHIAIQTSLYGDCRTIQNAWDAYYEPSYPMTVMDEWEESGVRYQTSIYEKTDAICYFITGNDTSTNRGFFIRLQLCNEWSREDGRELFDKLVKGISYDSSKTEIDHLEAYSGKARSPHLI